MLPLEVCDLTGELSRGINRADDFHVSSDETIL